MPSRLITLKEMIITNNFTLPKVKTRLSKFDLSHELMTAMDGNYLYPVLSKELSPGDNFDISINSLARMSPLVAPFMTPVKLKYFAFWVPNSLLWKGWKEFMGEQVWQDANPNRTIPTLKFTKDVEVGSIYDHMGLPAKTGLNYTNSNISALKFRAYKKIWNDWFRAPELQAPLSENTGDVELNDDYTLLKKGKDYDYFTSCLPTPQAGDPVRIPLIGNAPVYGSSADGNGDTLESGLYTQGSNGVNGLLVRKDYKNIGVGAKELEKTSIYADMSQVLGVSIEQLRYASAIQVVLENDNRYGRRYFEVVKAHWGIEMPAFLTGRSIFLGSLTDNVDVSPVVQNSSTDPTSPQGNLAGLGITFTNGKLCECSAVEHGQLIVLASINSPSLYQQGIEREMFRHTRFDYPFPEFANLGDQAVYNKELFVDGSANDDKVFGYQERYGELRTGFNRVTGVLRSGVKNSLDVWHLGEKFENLPKLNDKFIESSTPIERVLAVLEEPAFICKIKFNISALRALPVSAKPSLLSGRV